MTRAIVLILGLALGLALAVAVGGRMAHLRLIAGDALPGWTAGLAGDAGLLRGQGEVSGAALRWELSGIDGGGPRWAVSLAGPDWQLRATLRPRPGALRFTAVQGLVPGALLSAQGQGLFAVADGDLWLSRAGSQTPEGWLEGRGSGLALASGAPPMDGDLRIEAAQGLWTVAAR